MFPRGPAILLALLTVASAVPDHPALAAAKRCAGRRATIVGTKGRDRLVGTPGRDVIAAGPGRDTVLGRGGPDLICGGTGNDRIRGGPGKDRLLGQRGSDTIDGDAGDDALRGGSGHDICFQGWGTGRSRGCVPVVAAAGDIACDPADADFNGTQGAANRCRMRMTSDLLLRTNLAAVLALGDDQYQQGTAAQFRASYDPTWGRVRSITRPVPGNHEYHTEGAAGYFEYFGAAAGDPARGYYSFDVGRWHLVALNTSDDCAVVGCQAGSPQHAWLEQDLARSTHRCTLAYWHEPRFTTAGADDPKLIPFWESLHADGAEVVLSGHAHVYERFVRQRPNGTPSPRGVRQFTVGTGGKDLRGFSGDSPNLQVRSGDSFGVLELALAPDRYAWRFVPEEGSAAPFTDRGSARCR